MVAAANPFMDQYQKAEYCAQSMAKQLRCAHVHALAEEQARRARVHALAEEQARRVCADAEEQARHA